MGRREELEDVVPVWFGEIVNADYGECVDLFLTEK